MGSANESRRYYVKSSLIGRVHTKIEQYIDQSLPLPRSKLTITEIKAYHTKIEQYIDQSFALPALF